MIEIVPNWHPIFVHFPLALLSMSTMFFLLAAIGKRHRLHREWLAVAHWNLWLGAGFAAIAGVTGWQAYNSVAHDTASHLAMTDHRNWALATLAVFLPLAAWSAWSRYRSRPIDGMFLVLTVVGIAVLVSTGWRGGELVFRHGLGVLSLPTKSAGDGHDHVHDDETVRTPVAGPEPELGNVPETQPTPRSAGTRTHVHKDGRVDEH